MNKKIPIFGIVILFIIIGTLGVHAALTDSVSSYFTYEENYNDLLSNRTIVVGAVEIANIGVPKTLSSKSVYYNNSAANQVMELNNTNTTKNFTINFWVNITTADQYDNILHMMNGGNSKLQIGFDQLAAGCTSGTSNLCFYSTGTANSISYSSYFNKETMFTITRNNTNYLIYLNGELVQALTLNTASENNMTIGNQVNLRSRQMNGYIDELAMWEVSLNSTEISTLYNSGSGYSLITNNQNLTILINDTRTGSLISGFSWNYTTTNTSDGNTKSGYCSSTTCSITNYTGIINITTFNISNGYFNPYDSPKLYFNYSSTNTSYTFQTFKNSLNMNLTNEVNGTSIISFCAQASNNTQNISGCTTNGSITLTEIIGDITLLWYNISNGTYFNQSISIAGFNSTNANYTNRTYQSLLNISAKQLFTDNTIMNFNSTNGLTSNQTSTGQLLIKANAGSNNLKVDVTGNYSINATCNVTQLTTTNCIVTGIYDNLYTIGAKAKNGTIINNFSLQTTNNTLGGQLYNSTTTNGTLQLPLLQGYTYLFAIQPIGYAYTNISLAANNTTNAYNFSVYTKNSYNISFYDETTKTLINTTAISVEFIGELYSNNYSTSTGRLYVDLLTPDTYTIRYRSNGYSTRTYEVTLQDNTFTELNLTLLNGTVSTNVTVTVIDEIGNEIEGAIIKVKKFDLATNDYPIDQIVTTNFEGQAIIDIIINTEYYKFIVESGGNVVLNTEKTYIYGTTLTLQVNTRSAAFEDVFTNAALSGTITFNNNTNIATFNYNDKTNTATQSCIYAYKFSNNQKTLYNSTCSSISSGSVSIGVTNASNPTYIFEGIITVGGTEYLVYTKSYSYTTTLPEQTKGFGLLITFIIMIVLIFVARYSLVGAIILGSSAPLFMSIAHLNSISIQASAGVFILGLLVAYFVGVKQ